LGSWDHWAVTITSSGKIIVYKNGVATGTVIAGVGD